MPATFAFHFVQRMLHVKFRLSQIHPIFWSTRSIPPLRCGTVRAFTKKRDFQAPRNSSHASTVNWLPPNFRAISIYFAEVGDGGLRTAIYTYTQEYVRTNRNNLRPPSTVAKTSRNVQVTSLTNQTNQHFTLFTYLASTFSTTSRTTVLSYL